METDFFLLQKRLFQIWLAWFTGSKLIICWMYKTEALLHIQKSRRKRSQCWKWFDRSTQGGGDSFFALLNRSYKEIYNALRAKNYGLLVILETSKISCQSGVEWSRALGLMQRFEVRLPFAAFVRLLSVNMLESALSSIILCQNVKFA